MAIIITAIYDAVGASKGNAIGISLVPLRSFITSTMLLTLVAMAMALERLGG